MDPADSKPTDIDKKKLLCLVKTNNLMELLPIILNDKPGDDWMITPSDFIREMSLTTEERYKKLLSQTPAPIGQNYSDIILNPRILVFQQFKARKQYTMQIQIRNGRKVLLPVRMICPKSSFFSARHISPPTGKIAPGLSAEFEVLFCPREEKDYSHHIEFQTQEDLISVPILGIGPRPLLDIPDEITIQPAPVKIAATKVVIIRNIGIIPAAFTFLTRGYFRVEPSKGDLAVQDILQLSVIFESPVAGCFCEYMHLCLHTGEKLTIKLHGSAENIAVRLDKRNIIHDDTYVGLKRSKIFHLHNNSQSMIRYSWRRNSSMKEDLEIIESMREKYEKIKDLEVLKANKQIYHKVCSYKTHALAWERILTDELRLLEKEEFHFRHPAFKIEPESGELFPKARAEMLAVFEPTACGPVSTEAYLEVSGVEERLVLSMKGTGLGPYIALSVEILDIDFIFLCSLHTYEVIACNKGHIPGTITFKQEPLVFGGKVEVIPTSRHLEPNDHVALIITFTSNRHGDFTEKLNFVIAETGEIVSLILKGKIVSPTLHFDKTQIDFGTIPVGFPTSKEVTLSNLSMVPVTFSLRVLSEGNQQSLSYEKFGKMTVKSSLPKSPKEFRIDPSEGVVEPYSSRTVTLTLTTNVARKWATHLMVDMWDSETESVSCPIRFNSQIATVTVEPTIISIPFCFINFPYTRLITLENASKIAGFFYIVPQNPYETHTVTYSANITQGIIEPKGVAKVSLTILTSALGRQTLPLSVLIFGNDAPIEMCQICCVGQGPVVTVRPTNLSWGEIPLLQESTKYLTITNESPIPANFSITMLKPDSPWIVTPSHSILTSQEKVTLNVTLLLRDRGKYQDALKIQIVNGKTLSCSMNAVGVGNSLLMQPNIADKYNLGTLFSHKKYVFEILVKNEGTKTISMVWCPIEDFRSFVAMKFNNPTELLFKIEPTKVELPGGCSKILTLEVHSSRIGSYSQMFYCHANIEVPTKELYMVSEVSAEFVEPLIVFDKTELSFYHNISASGVEEKLSDAVNVINMSVLPLNVNVVVNHPFYIRKSSGEAVQRDEIELAGNEKKEIAIGFRVMEETGRHCRIYRDKLNIAFKEHSKKSTMYLVGEVNYPNVIILPRSLNFGCLSVGSAAYREFILVNISPVAVHYRIYWEEKTSYMDDLTEIYEEVQDDDKSLNSLKYGESLDIMEYNEKVDKEPVKQQSCGGGGVMQGAGGGGGDAMQDDELSRPEKPIMKIPNINISQADIKRMVFPLVRKYYNSDDRLMSTYKNSISNSVAGTLKSKPNFTQVFDVTPFYGRLENYESQIVSVSFHPNMPMKAHVEARLEIVAGPMMVVSIDGMAAELTYSLSKSHIDFGRQIFCEAASEYLRIMNTSLLEFDFEANTVDPIQIDANGDFPIEAGVLVITPRIGTVPALSEKILRIRYHPGLPGKYDEHFQLRIGYLDPITIHVSGYAVFPQIHFSLPRNEISYLPVEIGYAAIASITSDWLLSELHYKKYPMSITTCPNTKRKPASQDEGMDSTDPFDWLIISRSDIKPSHIDIELAIERILAFKLLSNATTNSCVKIFARSIPDFVVPAYEIDFGVVTIGRTFEQTFCVTNYGPLPAVLYFAVEKDYKRRVMQIRMKSRNEIKVGGTSQITIHFDPKRNRFTGQYEKIEYVFHFEVYQGARIPVKASAVVTYPFVTPSTKSLNFAEVKCGNCKVMYMKLKNFGWVPASWSLSFRLTPREISTMHQAGVLDGRTMFYVASNKGVLYPSESCILRISFKPEFGGRFSASMIVKVEEGFDEHKIMLTGESIESRLKISDAVITFEPTLPYPKKFHKYFTIQNPCPFPIEFYLPDFDEQVYEEEKVLRAIAVYYQTNEILLPARNPGDKLPYELSDFYHFMLENLNAKYVEKIREQRFQSTQSVPSSTGIVADDLISSSESTEKRKSRTKRGSSTSRQRLSILLQSATTLSHVDEDGVSVFRDRNPEEVEELLAEFIKARTSFDNRLDPLQAVIESVTTPKNNDVLEPMPGAIVILHAAPRTNQIQFAKNCARILNKPLMSIDRIVLEEIAYVRCNAAIVLRGLIEQAYSEEMENSSRSNVVEASSVQVLTDKQSKEVQFEETVDELQRKLYIILQSRDGLGKLKSGHMADDKVSSTGSTKKDKTPAPNVKVVTMSGTVDTCDDLIYEILKFRLPMEAGNGVVIETLNSKWITNAVSALKLLIKAAGNVTELMVLCLMNSYEKYKGLLLEQEAEEAKRNMAAKEEALRLLEEESEEIFRSFPLDQEVKKEIQTKYLTLRKESYASFLKMVEERARHRSAKRAFVLKKSFQSITPTSPKVPGMRSSLPESASKEKGKSKEKEKESRPVASKMVIKREDEAPEQAQFDAFQEQLSEMKNFLEYWDRHLGTSHQVENTAGNKSGRKSATPRKTSSGESANKSIAFTGVPLWLIDQNDLSSSLLESVCQYLNQVIITRRRTYDSENWALDVPNSMTFSVVTSPPHRHAPHICGVFDLVTLDRSSSSLNEEMMERSDSFTKTASVDFQKMENSDSQASMKGKRGKAEVSKVRIDSSGSVVSRNAKNTRKSLGLNMMENKEHPLKSRLILQENETSYWSVQFRPTKPGKYDQSYQISLVSAPYHNNYVIKCTGLCDIPRLDMNPENIFSKVAMKKPSNLIYSPTFFYSNFYFDFGSVIPNQLKDESHNRELHAIFNLTNISSLPVDLKVVFADDAVRKEPIGSQNFDIEPTQAYLKPYQTCLLNVYANPSKFGVIHEVLMLFVRGNPKVETIKIKCYGVKVNVNVEPKAIDFDRMLLYRHAKRNVTFTNSNLIPLFIALSGCDNLPPQFSFSTVKSWIQPLMSFTIEIDYEANEIQMISDKVIQVLVYDRMEAVDPVQTLSFTVSAEAYDASVEIFFATKEENHVDFDELRVQNECKKSVTLKNTGKYMLGFKIDIDNDLLDMRSNTKEFYVTPEEGKLPVGKPFPLSVHFRAWTEVNWKRIPLFRVTLTEPYNNDELIASIPIEVSARTFYSRYTIQPSSELNLGPVQISSQKTVTLSIENKGHFSLTYSIEPLHAVEATPPSLQQLEYDNKKSNTKANEASSKEKPQKKSAGNTLRAGAFDVSPCSGTVDVHETTVISVNFSPTEVKHYEDVVVVRISECPPHLKDGNELKITAEGCLPMINFEEYASVFREHYVKKNEKDLSYLPDIGFQSIFTIDSKQLCFKNVCLGKTVEAKIHLQNIGQIDCHVTAVVNKVEGKRSRSMIELEGESFWVKPQELLIPTYESGTFILYFHPEVIQSYRSQLVLSLTMPDKYGPSGATFDIVAMTCMPQVEIVEPSLRSPDGLGLVNFPPTTPGTTSTSLISFKNVGKIDSKIIIELYHTDERVFCLTPKPSTEAMLKSCELSKPIDHTAMVTLTPGQTAEFDAFFKPTEIKKYSSNVRLFIVDNGFENISYKLTGESYLEEVILEKIQMAMPFVEDIPVDSSHTVPGHYSLNLGHCSIQKKRQVLARLSNKTEKDYFKFDWEDLSGSLTVQPSVGHLYPGTYKEILLVFQPHESTDMTETPLTCTLKKIHFPKFPHGPSWDSRLVQHQIVAVTEPDSHQSKVINRSSSRQDTHTTEIQVIGFEPEHEIIPDTTTELIVYITAVADYARPFCDVKNIDFSDTFMFQNRTYSFPIENIGNVPFDFTLEFVSVTYEPLKTDQCLQADPASIMKMKTSFTRLGNKAKESQNLISRRKTSRKKNVLHADRPKSLGSECLLDLLGNGQDQTGYRPSISSEITEDTYNPFRLENETGTVMPRETVQARLVFSPLDVNHYKGIIRMKVDNIHPDQVLPEIVVNARSIMPYCHFDVPESDYIKSGRRDYSRPGPIGSGPGVPLDANVKPIEIKVVGIRVTRPIHFYAINPTDTDYTFTWINVTQNQSGVVQSLHCTYLDGIIQAGRQKLMEFVVVSQIPGTFEYFWKFCIPEHRIEMTFLFVVVVQEPVMYFLSNNLIMRPTSIGATVTDTVTLINQDEVSSDFFFIPESLYSDGRLNSLKVTPLSGRIEPKSEMTFRVSFVGKTGGKILFNLKFKLKKLQSPISITVETMTYAVEPLVTFEDLSKAKHIADPSMNNIIDFGKELQTECHETMTFFITSTAKMSFYYEWSFDKKELLRNNCTLTISQMSGHVTSFSRSEFEMTIYFARKSSLVNFPVKLKITRGPTYNFLVSACATSPIFEFSFLRYDFGYCYLQSGDFSFYETTLLFKNKDKTQLLLESTADELKNFTVKLSDTIIAPGKEISIPIKFYPREYVKYDEEVIFTVAGLFEKAISLMGRGTEYKVTLANVSDANIHLGATRIGGKHMKEFSIMNKGLAPVTLLVGLGTQLPVDIIHLSHPEEHPIDLSLESLSTSASSRNYVTVMPSKPFVIKPKECYPLRVEYAPQRRMASFSETIYMQFQDKLEPLSVVTGTSIGAEFSLDRKYITFGAVVANYSTLSKLKLINSGDIGARFKWEIDVLDSEFSISPATGYLSAESDIVIEVTFHPKCIRYCIRKTVECKIFLSDTETYPSLFLKLSGDCVDLPQPMKSISFKCEARDLDVKTIEVQNRSGTDWRLMPIFSGEYFDGLDVIFVPSMSSVEYEITYTPLTMTTPEHLHTGSLFFCLPDGTGQLYELIGTSLPPSPCEVIEREVPCKTNYTELLKVRNWLRSHQRLVITRTCSLTEGGEDPVYRCNGADSLELPPMSEKEYKLHFFAYKVGKLRFAVTFTNVETKEYIWFDITFHITMCGPLEVITIKSPLRQLCPYNIKLENPLATTVQYKFDCSNSEVVLPGMTPVPPESTKIVTISYRPIHLGQRKESLNITCSELGSFPMELHLLAMEPAPYDCIHFETPLGSADVQTVKIPNYHSSFAILYCKTTSTEFRVDEKVSVPGSDFVSIDITYEPSSLGQTLASLNIESEQAGNFTYPLAGNCLKPLAKGPYILKPGNSLFIPFKNVLREAKTFQIYVDNPAFQIKSSTEEIPPGGECKLQVTLQRFKNLDRLSITRDTGINVRYPVMGQLVVECFNPHIKWQYYLKGVVEKAPVTK